MDDVEEKRIGDLTVRIDRLLCVGFGDCIDEAPDTFVFDDEGIAVFTGGDDRTPRDVVIAACESCPVDAITAHVADGTQVAP